MSSPVRAAGDAPVSVAVAFNLADVRLLASPFKEAMDRNADYLLRLDADRLLHNTRKYAGLEPKGELYGGWEAKGIAGHTLGHYLTALAQQFAATGDPRFNARLDYIIGEMAVCQKAYGDGYVGALPPLELETLRGFKDGKLQLQGRFNFKGGAWVPWYTQHKILAGLIDAWTLAGNAQAKDVALKLADWVETITSGLTPEQQQTMLQVEHGGMIDALVELSTRTGDARYLALSRRFYHRAILDPLLAGRDELPGKHANTQIPKVIGEARTYEVAGDADGRKIAENFWNLVVHNYTFANGGNSDNEHFFPAAKAAQHLAHATAETCNTYNMLKLTKHLFAWEPKAEYADFYERALYNHILASQEPRHGMFTYFVSLKPGHFKTYSTPFDSFWCCVGSGIENHTKYGEAIYFHGADDLFVNLFIPSAVTWKEKGFTLEQHTDYPLGNVSVLTVKSAPSSTLTLRVRCPGWTTAPLSFELNGQSVSVTSQPGGYAEIARVWKPGDSLRITLPMSVRTEALHSAPDRVAFLYGPLLLAGDLGPV
ncbi:MAG: glycoside hydrolase family 127 protein, partial [Clostridia bacterium]|nr:glycoside hydrolase family 127 protein [Deltaproteobacteria bacterium]